MAVEASMKPHGRSAEIARDNTTPVQVHAKGALEVVRLSNFVRLSNQLAALAQAISEAPEIAEKKRDEASRVREQSLTLAACGGVRVPSTALMESVQQQASNATFITAEVARMAGELREARENLAGQAAELQQLCSEMRERFRETAQRLESCGAWRQALDDFRHEVHSGAERAARSEAERLQAAQLQSHLLLEGRIEELHGIWRAQDTDNSKAFKDAECKQARTEERLAELAVSLALAQKFPEAARAELQTASDALEESIYECRRHADAAKVSLQEELRTESQALAEKQKRAAAELHRQIRVTEKALREARTDQEEAHSRLSRHVENSRAGVEEEIQRRCEGLHEAVKAQHKLLTSGQEDTSASARRYVDEVRDGILPKIQAAAKVAETTAKISAQRLAEEIREELAKQVRELGSKMDAGDQRTKADFSAQLEIGLQRSDDRLDLAVREVLEKLEAQQVELKEDVHSAHLEAVQACEGLECLHNQFEYQNSLVTEQAGLLRNEVERSLSNLQTELAIVRDDLRSNLQQEVATFRQLSSAQEVQQASNLESLRETLLGEVNAQSRRITQADERLREKLSQATEDSQRALQAQDRVLREAREALDTELRRLLTQAEQSLRDVVASEFKRVEELEGSLSKVGAEGLGNQRRAEEAIDSLKALLEHVRKEAFAAQTQARNAEAATRQCADSVTQLRDAEVRSHMGNLEELQTAVGSLTSGLMKVAQCCGFTGAPDEHRSDHPPTSPHLPGNHVGIKELLAWERSGTPLFARIESSWVGSCSARAGTLLELVQQKADMTALNVVQAAVRDLDTRSWVSSRTSNYTAMRAWRESSSASRDSSRESSSAMCVRVGEPFVGAVGAYGSHARRSPPTSVAAGVAGPQQAQGEAQRCFESMGTTASCGSLASSHMRSDTMLSLNPCASADHALSAQHHESLDQAAEPTCRPPGLPPSAEGPLQRRAHMRHPYASAACASKSDVQA